MNALLFIVLISCFLNQVISESKLTSLDDNENQKNFLKYWYVHSSDYSNMLPKFSLPDYYFCKKALLNSDPFEFTYSNSIPRSSLKRPDRLNKRFDQNNLNDYRMNNVHYDELLPKSARNRKSDDPKIFRNLFLGSRG